MPTLIDPSVETTSLVPFPMVAERKYGDFRDALLSEGFVVLPSVVDDAGTHIAAAHDWLESFQLGYSRGDPSTYRTENLPTSFKGGLYNLYGISQEQFCWDIRQSPKVIEAFAKIWGTDELLVSFDGANIGVPLGLSDDDPRAKAWPHVDQSPLREHLHCIQGIVNLLPNGADDGGLMVLRGSIALYSEMFSAFAHLAPEGGWNPKDQYIFTNDQMEWFYSRGCEWHKVIAGPGDLILWDSRCCHYGTPPRSDNFRIATYVCYKPASLISQELLQKKVDAFHAYSKTTHDPINFDVVLNNEPASVNGVPDRAWAKRQSPVKAPVLSSVGRKLAGLESYK